MKEFLKDMARLTRLRRPLSPISQNVFFVLAIVLLVVGYTCLAYRGENRMIPRWDRLIDGTQNLFTDSRTGVHLIWVDTIASMMRLIPSVALATVIGVTIGLYMGLYTAAESLFARLIEFLGNVPPNAMMVVFLVLFGFNFSMFVAVITFGVFAMITKGIYLAVKAIPNDHVFSAKTLGASNQEVVWSVTFPMILPEVIELVRQAMSPAIIFLIGAEWVAGTDGFGHRFMQLYRSARMDVMFPYLIYLGLMGIVTSMIFRFLQRTLCPWYSKE